MATSKASDKNLKFLKAYLSFQQNSSPVKKRAKNPRFDSTYPKYDDCIADAGPDLHEAGLVYTHTSRYDEAGRWLIGTYLTHVESGESGDLFEMRCPEGEMQKEGGAITYAKRYTFLAATGLGSEDDDGNSANKSTPPPPPHSPAKAKHTEPEMAEIYSGTNEQKIKLFMWAAEKNIAPEDQKAIHTALIGKPFTKKEFNELTERWD